MMQANLQGPSTLTPSSQYKFETSKVLGCTSSQQGLCNDCVRLHSEADMAFSIA